jgi:DNA topoisomerase-1
MTNKISNVVKLIIVESPTKAKTISRFLGGDFKVESSYGHVRDLPKSKLGIDVEKDFEPAYIIPTKARKRVNELKKEAKNADEVLLATDEDREGEAIAWHLVHALDLGKSKRIAFHEITKSAIEEALKNPRDIDLNLVDAQQARRILDRLVGYELSPFLWKKVFKGLSAGRVQSATVRLIVDREKEIQAFIPQEFWSITAVLKKLKEEFEAKLFKKDGKTLDKFAIKTKEESDKVLKDLEGADYKVEKVERKEVKRAPKPPFTTSTLQQEAANRLHFSAKQTMMFAQQLYENGLITYMRTDSLNMSEESLKAAKQVVADKFGKEYSLSAPRKFKTKTKGAQEAHEAIRPTQPKLASQDLGGQAQLDKKHIQLYDLIWKRFIACQMKEAIFDSTTVDILAKSYTFRAAGSVVKFEGWMKVYKERIAENITEGMLPKLATNDILKLVMLIPNQHFTEPPPRYGEASLIKALEEHGIGRPSTYAPTIATIQLRNYVFKNNNKKFEPTETGILVNDLLVKHFPEIVDIEFTARVEKNLDEIAEGVKKWVPVIKKFYAPFHKNLEKKYEEVEKKNTDEKTDQVCEKCGKPMLIKHGRFGKFLACSGFPDCKNTKAIKEPPKTIGVKCPKCMERFSEEEAGDIIVRRTKKGKIFFGCSRYPDCDFASWKNPAEENKKAGHQASCA